MRLCPPLSLNQDFTVPRAFCVFNVGSPMSLCEQCTGGGVHVFIHAPRGGGGCLPPLRGLRGAWCERRASVSCECVRALGVGVSLLWQVALIFRGACLCCRLLGGNHFVVTPATVVAHASPGDHASRAWRQVVLRASLKHGQASHIPWRVVPHRAACCCRSVESMAGKVGVGTRPRC